VAGRRRRGDALTSSRNRIEVPCRSGNTNMPTPPSPPGRGAGRRVRAKSGVARDTACRRTPRRCRQGAGFGTRRQQMWSAVARRSRDTALRRCGTGESIVARKSGVARDTACRRTPRRCRRGAGFGTRRQQMWSAVARRSRDTALRRCGTGESIVARKSGVARDTACRRTPRRCRRGGGFGARRQQIWSAVARRSRDTAMRRSGTQRSEAKP